MKRSIRKVRSTLLLTLLIVFVILSVEFVSSFNKRKNSIQYEPEKSQVIHSKFTNLVQNVVKTFDTKNYQGTEILKTPERVTHPGLLKDWHDYKYLKIEKKRSGHGEQGKPVILNDTLEIEENNKEYDKTGYSVIVSDKISVNRSLPDNRHEICKDLLYFENLPNVSVIIIFHNELFKVLKRTLHSIWNRTPPTLLHEIILVNDNSSDPLLFEPLEEYTTANFPGKVKIKVLEKRSGLMVARNEGAKIATGEVLVFFDSHVEVNTNYLPPLIEPIVKNGRVGTVPIHDYIEPDTFEYILHEDFTGSRGVIDWKFDFHEFQKREEDMFAPFRPFPIPIMLGCGFAIKRQLFYELGGFDEGLRIWNGENYEMSFKLWLCASGLLQVPCSRVGHFFRDFNPSRKFSTDYVARNFKRVAEVWLDEYKEVLYASNPDRYKDVDPGDLTKQKELRKNLDCKPFKYFLEIVAPDFTNIYPPFVKPPAFASGVIESVPLKLCISRSSTDILEPVVLRDCSKNKVQPKLSQNFYFSFYKKIVHKKSFTCFDSFKPSLYECTGFTSGNQYWKYDMDTQWLINGIDTSNLCLTVFQNSTLGTARCDREDVYQKWTFGYLNETALRDFENINGYIKLL